MVQFKNMYSKKGLVILSALAISIMVISVSFFIANKNKKSNTKESEEKEEVVHSLDLIPNVSSDDHILGNPNAPIIFIVYSDFSCPYCKKYNKTLGLIMDLYGKDGDVAIVYRHLPFVQLHPESPMYAQASECVAHVAGNASFWKFADTLFEKADPLNPLSAGDIVALAEKSGASKKEFVACMRSDELMKRVEKDFNDAIGAGAKGSPFTVVLTENEKDSFDGAQKFRTLAIAVQSVIRSMGVKEIKNPSEEASFSEDFKNIDVENTGSSTQSASTSTKNTFLDGIVN